MTAWRSHIDGWGKALAACLAMLCLCLPSQAHAVICNANGMTDGLACTTIINTNGTCSAALCLSDGLECDGGNDGAQCVTTSGSRGVCDNGGCELTGLPLTMDTCTENQNFSDTDYTAKIVYCVRHTIITALSSMLLSISDYMKDTVTIIFVLAVALHGLRIIGQEGEIQPKTIVFLVKIAVVYMFSYNLGGMAPQVFGILDDLISMVVGGYEPWGQIDAFLGRLLGFAPNVYLYQGFLALIGAAFFTDTSGMAMGASLVFAMLNIIFLGFEIVFVYLSAVMAIAFLLILSPFFVPLLLFSEMDDRHFKKWLNALFANMLVPILLYGFCYMTLLLFNTLVADVFKVLGGNDFAGFWKTNIPFFSWMMPHDPNLGDFLKDKALTGGEADPKHIPPVHSVMNSFLHFGFDPRAFNLIGLNLGTDHQKVMHKLMYAGVTLFLYAYVVKSFVEKIPEIAGNMAAGVSGVSVQFPSSRQKIKKMQDEFKGGMGFAAGGLAGGEAGAALGGKDGPGREMGIIFGGLAGAMVGRRF